MSIFGTEGPRIITGADVTIDLDYAIVLKDEPEYKNLTHENEITGSRYFIQRGSHWLFDVQIHLWKYEGMPDPYDRLVSALYDDAIVVYKHRDGNPFQDSAGADVPFVLYELNPYYMTTTDYKDALILKFKSMKYVDIGRLSYSTRGMEDGGTRITEDGEDRITG
jgi:hypothetical protein